MSYVSIYRALMPPPTEPTTVIGGSEHAVFLHPGPFAIRYQRAAHEPHAVGHISLDYQVQEFPSGSYIIIVVAPQKQQTVIGGGWNAAYDRFAQTVGLLDLTFPGIAYEKVYEGTAALPGQTLFIDPEQGLDVGLVHEYEHASVVAELPTRVEGLALLSEADRGRFTLASRWFRRGNDAANPVDKVLFFWMVLEVFPSDDSDVVGSVVKLFAERVYPGVSDLKARLNLGRICGFRGEIVHDGKASVATMEELNVVKDHAQRLQAVARTCLRLLAGLAPGRDLDAYVHP